MFTVTAKGIYGLNALVELAKQHTKGPIQIKDIAELHNIPQHYLEQILVILKKAGIVESFRGAQGGYALAKSPSSIKIEDVLSQLEGKLELIPDQKKGNDIQFFWDRLEECIRHELQGTIEDLLNQQADLQQQLHYSI